MGWKGWKVQAMIGIHLHLLVPDLYHSYMEVNMVMTMTLLDMMIIAKKCHLKLQETATVIGNCT